METINTKKDLVQYIERNGSHFFDSDTKRFFRSRLLDTIVQKNQLVYFVTSEQFEFLGHCEPRLYTIRKLDLSTDRVNITEVGKGFQGYKTAKEAKRELHKFEGF